MKKKIIFMIVCFTIVFGITACAKKEETERNTNSNTEENRNSSTSKEESSTSSTNEEENPYVVALTSKEFFAKVNAKDSFYIAVVQDGCGACNAFKPIFHKLAKDEKITVYEINLTTDDREYVTKLIDDWGITHTPTTLYLQNGKEKNRLIGYQTEENMKSFIKK